MIHLIQIEYPHALSGLEAWWDIGTNEILDHNGERAKDLENLPFIVLEHDTLPPWKSLNTNQ